jgi:hypothetical protein
MKDILRGLLSSMEKLYVLVRKDLSKSQQAVQGGHAVAEYLLRDRSSFWDNGTLVYLAVDDEEDLKSWGEIFHIMYAEYAEFREPDINNELTAIAALLDKEEQDVVSDLRLL